MQRLKLYQIDSKYLEQALETYLLTAIKWEVEQSSNFEQFSFESVARRVNYLMNTSISGRAPSDNISNINPDDVEILGTHPFRNKSTQSADLKDRRFQITDDEACAIANRSDFIVNYCKH